jgi:hypothetical protein
MTQSLLAGARAGRTVCAAFYGHPGVFVWPSHDAIRRARAEGIRAIMEPGVSAEDCLFADLGLDPAVVGCAQYEATDFLVYRRRPDPSAALIVWQIGAVGDLAWNPGRTNADNVRVLVEELAATYGLDHIVVVYEAAQLPTCAPTILHVRLADLPLAPLTTASTLFVPPRERRAPDPAMIERLALDARRFGIGA